MLRTCMKPKQRVSVSAIGKLGVSISKKRYMAPPRAAMKPGAASWPVCYQFSPEAARSSCSDIVSLASCREHVFGDRAAGVPEDALYCV